MDLLVLALVGDAPASETLTAIALFLHISRYLVIDVGWTGEAAQHGPRPPEEPLRAETPGGEAGVHPGKRAGSRREGSGLARQKPPSSQPRIRPGGWGISSPTPQPLPQPAGPALQPHLDPVGPAPTQPVDTARVISSAPTLLAPPRPQPHPEPVGSAPNSRLAPPSPWYSAHL